MKVKEFKVGFAKTVSKNYNSQKLEVGMTCEVSEDENYGAELTKAFLYCKTKVHAFEQSLLQIVIKEVIKGEDKPEIEPQGVKNDMPNVMVGVIITEMSDKAIHIELNGKNTWLPKKSIVKGFGAHKDPQTIEVMDWMKEKIEWRDN